MILRNPFPLEVRLLFVDCWSCWLCGANGWNRGGLELHHIWGRISSSALNGAVLCGECHKHIKHTKEEHHRLLRKTILFLTDRSYRLVENDNNFLLLIKDELRGFELG